MQGLYEILKASKLDPNTAPDGITAIRARMMMSAAGGKTQTLTGQPPLSFKSNGTPLISWSMKGNGSQSGTPTPDNPVMPTFCGVRTAQLFDPNFTRYHMGKGTNNKIGAAPNGAMFYIKATPNTNYTIKIHTTDSTFVRLYLSNAPIVEDVSESYNVISESETMVNPEVTISNTDYAYLWIQVGGTWYTEHGGGSIMLNSGTTALPYEPYGLAEKITCAGQTTPVYLGQVSTVRKIRKLVLTGGESWSSTNSCFIIWLYDIGYPNPKQELIYCTHYKGRTPTYRGSLANGQCMITINQNQIAIKDSSYETVKDFKAYLASEYAAGTPVTVWYVLANEQTGIVNEPLAKIGDYADELHSTDAGVTIPTIKGQNTLIVDTELQPSSMTITYKE